MEITDYGSLIDSTHSGGGSREIVVKAIAKKIKGDYCVLPDIHILKLDIIENALINADDGEVVEIYLNAFISECKTAISDHKL
jgi:hypothetical protein